MVWVGVIALAGVLQQAAVPAVHCKLIRAGQAWQSTCAEALARAKR